MVVECFFFFIGEESVKDCVWWYCLDVKIKGMVLLCVFLEFSGDCEGRGVSVKDFVVDRWCMVYVE